jgi:hypothetical protein
MSNNDYMGDCNLDILQDNNIKITNKHLILIVMKIFKFKLPFKKNLKKNQILVGQYLGNFVAKEL